eukprot:TRINITY_DN11537_c0_g1_i3.p1 TRINITY_DN11537_c0_g1~~TRINITY_DN11537_c0_g1_i3.p1  ORF type:complete len:181 (+),score=21.58 TRINITY_DN11537_c0_g1_i3:129-671(+)
MSIALGKSSSFRNQGNLSSGLHAGSHAHGGKVVECQSFPPTLRRTPSASAGRQFDPWRNFCGDWGNDDYTFRIGDHIRSVKDGRLTVVAAGFRKRVADFKISRVTLEGELLTFRMELPGSVIDWHLKWNADNTLVGTSHNHHFGHIKSEHLTKQGWLNKVDRTRYTHREIVMGEKNARGM